MSTFILTTPRHGTQTHTSLVAAVDAAARSLVASLKGMYSGDPYPVAIERAIEALAGSAAEGTISGPAGSAFGKGNNPYGSLRGKVTFRREGEVFPSQIGEAWDLVAIRKLRMQLADARRYIEGGKRTLLDDTRALQILKEYGRPGEFEAAEAKLAA